MTPRNIIVIGSGGMLGGVMTWLFQSQGHRVKGLARADFSIGVDSVERIDLRDTHYVVNAAGIINRRFSTPDGRAEAGLVNTDFPHQLSAYCASRAVPLVHVSTDCVFDGKGGPYDERSLAIPKDDYGRTKLAGEPPDCLVLRTSVVGPEIHRGYSLLCWFLQQREECTGYRNHLWNGITSLEFSKCVSDIMASDLFEHRVQHVFGHDTTKFELLGLFAEAFEHQIRLVPDDADRRDTRLRTAYSDGLAGLASVKTPMRDQLSEMRPLCDRLGRWIPVESSAGGSLSGKRLE